MSALGAERAGRLGLDAKACRAGVPLGSRLAGAYRPRPAITRRGQVVVHARLLGNRNLQRKLLERLAETAKRRKDAGQGSKPGAPTPPPSDAAPPEQAAPTARGAGAASPSASDAPPGIDTARPPPPGQNGAPSTADATAPRRQPRLAEPDIIMGAPTTRASPRPRAQSRVDVPTPRRELERLRQKQQLAQASAARAATCSSDGGAGPRRTERAANLAHGVPLSRSLASLGAIVAVRGFPVTEARTATAAAASAAAALPDDDDDEDSSDDEVFLADSYDEDDDRSLPKGKGITRARKRRAREEARAALREARTALADLGVREDRVDKVLDAMLTFRVSQGRVTGSVDRRRTAMLVRNAQLVAEYLVESCHVEPGPKGVGKLIANAPRLLMCKPTANDRWYRRALDLAAFQHRFGHCNVPDKWEENPELPRWLRRQFVEMAQSSLAPERTAILREVGLEFEKLQRVTADWEGMFDRLLETLLESGAQVPGRASAEDGGGAEAPLPAEEDDDSGGAAETEGEEVVLVPPASFDWSCTEMMASRDPARWEVGRWVLLQRELGARQLLGVEGQRRLERIGFPWELDGEPRWAQSVRGLLFALHCRRQEVLKRCTEDGTAQLRRSPRAASLGESDDEEDARFVLGTVDIEGDSENVQAAVSDTYESRRAGAALSAGDGALACETHAAWLPVLNAVGAERLLAHALKVSDGRGGGDVPTPVASQLLRAAAAGGGAAARHGANGRKAATAPSLLAQRPDLGSPARHARAEHGHAASEAGAAAWPVELRAETALAAAPVSGAMFGGDGDGDGQDGALGLVTRYRSGAAAARGAAERAIGAALGGDVGPVGSGSVSEGSGASSLLAASEVAQSQGLTWGLVWQPMLRRLDNAVRIPQQLAQWTREQQLRVVRPYGEDDSPLNEASILVQLGIPPDPYAGLFELFARALAAEAGTAALPVATALALLRDTLDTAAYESDVDGLSERVRELTARMDSGAAAGAEHVRAVEILPAANDPAKARRMLRRWLRVQRWRQSLGLLPPESTQLLGVLGLDWALTADLPGWAALSPLDASHCSLRRAPQDAGGAESPISAWAAAAQVGSRDELAELVVAWVCGDGDGAGPDAAYAWCSGLSSHCADVVAPARGGRRDAMGRAAEAWRRQQPLLRALGVLTPRQERLLDELGLPAAGEPRAAARAVAGWLDLARLLCQDRHGGVVAAVSRAEVEAAAKWVAGQRKERRRTGASRQLQLARVFW
ncbi:unnamed protein product [Pedinophyceae sp. YPF-701]|nr:unnamed protein product [Pedinophyceae sp. YPF-701]